MNHITAIKLASCAYAFCLFHSISYAPPILLKKLLPCCFESPSESPDVTPKASQSMLQNFLMLESAQNPAAAPFYKTKPLHLVEKRETEEEEMQTIHLQPSAPPPSPQTQSYQLPPALYDQMVVRNFTSPSPQTPCQRRNPPPSLIEKEEDEEGKTISPRNNSDDEFVMITPRKQEFEI